MFAKYIFFLLASEVRGYSTSWQDSSISQQQQILQDCLVAKAVPTTLNSSSDWSLLTTAYNLRRQYTPTAVTLPTTPQHVSDSVTCALAAGVKVQPRSGGHSYGSYSLGGKNRSLMVDLQKFNSISLSKCKLHGLIILCLASHIIKNLVIVLLTLLSNWHRNRREVFDSEI
jgi:hypothetical protein